MRIRVPVNFFIDIEQELSDEDLRYIETLFSGVKFELLNGARQTLAVDLLGYSTEACEVIEE